MENQTTNKEFRLLGFHSSHQLKILLFFVFLVSYIMTLTGNILIILLVNATRRLHSPMYFFLCHLSISDILFITNIVPNTLHVLLVEVATVHALGCFTQLFLFGSLTVTECLLLTMMSFDRYMAICNPLRYTILMNLQLCIHLSFWAWVAGFTLSAAILYLISQMEFCTSNVIDHFFCDFPVVLVLSCSDTSMVEWGAFVISIHAILFPFIFIGVTYACIIHAILKISSNTGRQKAFSTCSSHLAVVCAYYGTLITLYVTPSKGHSYNVNKFLSFLYTVVTPLFNPIIYTLRNQEIRTVLSNIIGRKGFLSRF